VERCRGISQQSRIGFPTKAEDKENISFLRGSTYEREKKFDLAETEFKKVLTR